MASIVANPTSSVDTSDKNLKFQLWNSFQNTSDNDDAYYIAIFGVMMMIKCVYDLEIHDSIIVF